MRGVEHVARARSALALGVRYKLGAGGMDPLSVTPANAAGQCDCSGFVCWVLGISRVTDDPFYIRTSRDRIAGKLVGWISTASMVADGRSPDGMFDLIPDDQAQPGDVWTFGPNAGRTYGHTGIISAVIGGKPDKVIHCSSMNEPSAIQETDGLTFRRNKAIILRFAQRRVEAPAPAAKAATHGYRPPLDALGNLARVAALVSAAPQVRASLAGLKFMCRLPGALYFDSDLDLDTDGEEEPGITYEPTHQTGVSIRGGANSNRVPYIALPGAFYAEHNIRMGDVAAVLHKGRLAFAVFADVGPRTKIGEGSIALHRLLGYERVKNKRIVDVGIPGDVLTIVFAGSGNGTAQTPEAIERIGRELFARLGGNP